MTAAAGPEGDDESGRGYPFFEPVAGAIEKRCGCQEVMAIGGSGGDLTLACGGDDGDGVHAVAFWALYRRIHRDVL